MKEVHDSSRITVVRATGDRVSRAIQVSGLCTIRLHRFEWVLRKAEFKQVFPTAFALWKTAKGEQYAFPFDLDIPALFYNKELFDAAGIEYPNDKWTWDDMLKAAIALTKDTDGDGQPDQYGFTNWYFHWATLVWATRALTRPLPISRSWFRPLWREPSRPG